MVIISRRSLYTGSLYSKFYLLYYLVWQPKDHFREQAWVVLKHVAGVALHILTQEERGHVWGDGRRVTLQQLT